MGYIWNATSTRSRSRSRSQLSSPQLFSPSASYIRLAASNMAIRERHLRTCLVC